MNLPAQYPVSPADRTQWIAAHRSLAPAKNRLDPWKPYALLQEEECGPDGSQIATTTVFLTNRECPYRCLMCDLWINTLNVTVPKGAIPAQIRHALDRLSNKERPADASPTQLPTISGSPLLARGAVRRGAGGEVARSVAGRGVYPLGGGEVNQIKLYNAGSFFDPKAIPTDEYPDIAEAVSSFGRVVVECHPALIGPRALDFARLLEGRLEVAIGLETANPEALDKLNKRFTVEDFRHAADFLAHNGIALRVFLLLRPPFVSEADGLEWIARSIDTAFEAGAEVCCVIPTRGGNGAMELLSARGQFEPPRLTSLERAVEYGVGLGRGRVFADLWDAERLCTCSCSRDRLRRLEVMNRTQAIPSAVFCDKCGADE